MSKQSRARGCSSNPAKQLRLRFLLRLRLRVKAIVREEGGEELGLWLGLSFGPVVGEETCRGKFDIDLRAIGGRCREQSRAIENIYT